ncbi:UNVERIFIED_CONTAM: DUF3987 domain-containing protein [Aeromonas hydrophila]
MSNPYDLTSGPSYYNPYRGGNTYQDYSTGYRLAEQDRHSQNMAILARCLGLSAKMLKGIELSAVSIAAGEKYRLIHPRSKMELGLNEFVLVVGKSGDGKTPALNTVLHPIFEFIKKEQASIEEHIKVAKKDEEIGKSKTRALKRRYEQAISRELVDKALHCKLELEQHLSDMPSVPEQKIRILNKISLSGIKKAMKKSNVLSFILPEATKAIMDFISILNPAWNNESIALSERDGDIKVTMPIISLLMLIQPELLSTLAKRNRTFFYSGLGARFLIFTADKPPSLPKKSDEGETLLASIQQRCLELLATPDVKSLHLSAQATDRWNFIADRINSLKEQEGTKEAAIPEFSGKYPEHLLRVAALIHLLYKNNEVVDEDDINQAEIIMQEVHEEHLHYFSDSNKHGKLEQDAQQVLEWLKRYSEYRRITVHNVNKNGPACARDRELLQQQLDLLVSRGDITLHQSGKSIFVKLAVKSRIILF